MQIRIKILAVVMILTGMVLIGAPFVSEIMHNGQVEDQIKSYEEKRSDKREYETILAEARAYNDALDPMRRSVMDPFAVSDYSAPSPLTAFEATEPYAYLWIPKLGEKLPVYLSARSENFSRGVVLVEGTDIPAGEPHTLTVLAGTQDFLLGGRFGDIDQLGEGDNIYLYSFHKRETYTVVNRAVFWPSENDNYLPSTEVQQLGLLTATPYPVNNQRLLVIAKKTDENLIDQSVVQDMENLKSSSEDHFYLQYQFRRMAITVVVMTVLAGVPVLLLKSKR